MRHLYGAYEDGDRSDRDNYREEQYIRRLNAEKGDHLNASYPDLTWGLVDSYENEVQKGPKAHANTVSIRKDRSMTSDERRRFDNLVQNAADHVVKFLRKLRPGDDEDAYRKEARNVCRAMFTDLREKIQEYDDNQSSDEKGTSSND